MHIKPVYLATLLAAVSATSCAPALTPPPAALPAGVAAPNGPMLHARPARGPAAPARTFGGLVSFGGPVAGATVTLLDAAGLPVGEPMRTSPEGGFLRAAEGLPAAFTVVVSGGTLGAKPFTGELRAVVAHLDASTDSVVVSLASTIAARALAARSSTDPAALTMAASAALGLPARRATSLAVEQLDVPAVLAEAARAGSFDAWVATRAADLLAGRPFARGYQVRETRRSGVESGIAAMIGTGLLTTGVGAAAGFLATKGLTEALRGLGLETRTTNADLLVDIKKLNSQLDGIQSQLDDTTARIAGQQYAAQYAVQFQWTVGPLVAFQEDLFDDLTVLVAARNAAATPAERDAVAVRTNALVADIKTHVIDQEPWSLWEQALVTRGLSTDSLTSSYSKFVATSAPFNGRVWSPKEAQAIADWFDVIDAYMAHTAFFMANYNKMVGAGDSQNLKVSTEWQRVRSQWLAIIRGINRPVDKHVYGPALPTEVSTTLPYAALPGATAFGDAGWLVPADRKSSVDALMWFRWNTRLIQDIARQTEKSGWDVTSSYDWNRYKIYAGATDVVSLIQAIGAESTTSFTGQQALWSYNMARSQAQDQIVFLDGAFTEEYPDPTNSAFEPYLVLRNSSPAPCMSYAENVPCQVLASPSPFHWSWHF